MDLLNHREGGVVFYQVFLFSPYSVLTHCRNCKRLSEGLKNNKSQGRPVEMTLKSKEKNFCLYFVQEFGLWYCRLARLQCGVGTEYSVHDWHT